MAQLLKQVHGRDEMIDVTYAIFMLLQHLVHEYLC